MKAIYGLCNAPKACFDTIKQFIVGFCQSALDPCLYFRHINNSIIMILTYVDDIIIFEKDRETIDGVVQMFKNRFACKILAYFFF